MQEERLTVPERRPFLLPTLNWASIYTLASFMLLRFHDKKKRKTSDESYFW